MPQRAGDGLVADTSRQSALGSKPAPWGILRFRSAPQDAALATKQHAAWPGRAAIALQKKLVCHGGADRD